MTDISDSKRNRKRTGGERPSTRKSIDTREFDAFLQSLSLEGAPKIHINSHYAPALVVVDFGNPLTPVRLTADQTHDLMANLRRTARDVLGRDANIRVNHDQSAGIYWAALA